MNIAVASGKGGTGKTFLSTNLFNVLQKSFKDVAYYDCDVEEPNGHLFIKPENINEEVISVEIPEVDSSKCIKCGKCGELCQYNAITLIASKIYVFEDLCHSCGGCNLVCPVGAISNVKHRVGTIQSGELANAKFYSGCLDVGKILTVPIIKQLTKYFHKNSEYINIIDAPPGTSCPVVASVSSVDYVLLVTEPTKFGLNDLSLIVKMLKKFDVPYSVVLNRSGLGKNSLIEDFCKEENIPIDLKIPFSREISTVYSSGGLFSDSSENFKTDLLNLFETIQERLA